VASPLPPDPALVAGVLGSLPLGAGKYAQSLIAKVASSSAAFATAGEAQEAILQQIAKDYDPKAGYTVDQKRIIAALILGAGMGGLHHAFEDRGQQPQQPQPGAAAGPTARRAGRTDAAARSTARARNPVQAPGAGAGPGSGGPQPGPAARWPRSAAGPARRWRWPAAVPVARRPAAVPARLAKPATPWTRPRAPRWSASTGISSRAKTRASLSDGELFDIVNDHLRDTSSTGHTAKPETPEEAAARQQAATERTEREALKRRGWTDAHINAMTPEQRRKYFQDAMAGEQTPPPGEQPQAGKAGKAGNGPEMAEDANLRKNASSAERATTSPDDVTAQAAPATESDVPRASGTRGDPIEIRTADDVAAVTAPASGDYTHAQGEANNRQLGHGKWNGRDVRFEVAKGGTRKMQNPETGEPVEVTHAGAAYGYFPGTVGADGMHVDFSMGDHPDSPDVYVIDEIDRDTGKFRQHKVIGGTRSERDAFAAYVQTSTKGPETVGAITKMSVPELFNWLDNGDTTKPLRFRKRPDGARGGKPVESTHADGRIRGTEAGDIVSETAPSGSGQRTVSETANEGGGHDVRSPKETPAAAEGAQSSGGSEPITPNDRGRSSTAQGKFGGSPKGSDQPLSLLQFIASKGGVRHDQELNALDLRGDHRVQIPGRKGFFGVVRPTGESLDRMREMAEEAGYLRGEAGRTSTVRDFLDAIDAELRGQKLHAEGEEGALSKREQQLAAEQEQHERERYEADYGPAEAELKDAGYTDLHADLRSAAIRLMADEGMSADDAVERAAMQLVATDTDYGVTPDAIRDTFGTGAYDEVRTPAASADGGRSAREREEGARPDEGEEDRGDGTDVSDSGPQGREREGEIAQARAEVETALGPDAELVLPVDIERAAELMTDNPGMPPEIAFGQAVAAGSVEQGFLTKEQAEAAYGPEINDVLESGQAGAPVRSGDAEPERAEPDEIRSGEAAETGVVPSSGKTRRKGKTAKAAGKAADTADTEGSAQSGAAARRKQAAGDETGDTDQYGDAAEDADNANIAKPYPYTADRTQPERIVPMPIELKDFETITDEWAALFTDPPVQMNLATRLQKGPFIPLEEAQKRVDQWRADAIAQADKHGSENFNKTILSLYDLTGNWARPWAEAGYNVLMFDIQAGQDVHDFSVEYFTENYDITDVYGILIAQPCTDFAVSGARHFKAKDERGDTAKSIELVHQSLRTVEYFRPKFWVLENPMSRIEKLAGLPKWRMIFNPSNFGDPYTKKTALWGDFQEIDMPTANVEPTEGSKMWAKYGGKSQATKNARSATPEGFAYAFFKANNYADKSPQKQLYEDYPEITGAISAALRSNIEPERIRELVDRDYGDYEYDKARDKLIVEAHGVDALATEKEPEGSYDLDGATAEIQAADADELVTVKLTRDGPWDFSDTYPAPTPEQLRNLEADGRNPFGDMPPTVEQVAYTFDESINELMSDISEIRTIDGMIADIRAGKTKLKRNQKPEDTIKALQADRAKRAEDIRGTHGVYADLFGQKAANAMVAEARRRIVQEEGQRDRGVVRRRPEPEPERRQLVDELKGRAAVLFRKAIESGQPAEAANLLTRARELYLENPHGGILDRVSRLLRTMMHGKQGHTDVGRALMELRGTLDSFEKPKEPTAAEKKAERDAPTWAEVLAELPMHKDGRTREHEIAFSIMKEIANKSKFNDLTPAQKHELLARVKKPAEKDAFDDIFDKAVDEQFAKPAPTTETGADGKPQTVIPGAEQAPSATMAKRAAAAPLKPKVAQKGTDFGLFGDESKQSDMMDMLAKAPPPKGGSMSLDDVSKGLGALFGKKPGLSEAEAPFSDDTYQQALPYFKAGVAHFPGADLTIMVRALVKHLAGAGMDADAIRAMKPYIKRFTEDVTAGRETINAPSGSDVLESGGREPAARDTVGETDVPAPAERVGRSTGGRGEAADAGDQRPGGGERLPESHAPVVGEGGNLELPAREPVDADSDAADRERARSAPDGEEGFSFDDGANDDAIKNAQKAADVNARRERQRQAEGVEVIDGNIGNIAETLPMLHPEQHGDVLAAEQRFAKPDGHGMLFTNGTGTGKTYSGLGVIKRFTKKGQGQILVVAPSQGILMDWQRSAKDLGLDMNVLDSTVDKGKPGLNGTTYANLGDNPTLADHDWHLVVADEAHKLSSDQNGTKTKALATLRALTKHPDGLMDRARMVFRREWDAIPKLPEKPTAEQSKAYTEANLKFNDKATPAILKWKGEARPKALMMSATPFAYHFSLDYAEGYLFEFGEDKGTGYNSPTGRDAFYMQHLGYRKRVGKLTKPDADVKQEIMERQLHEYLKKTGSLHGRALTVDKDYDRKFVLAHNAAGELIDRALNFLQEAEGGRYRPLHEIISKQFDYLARMRLLEAMKAQDAVGYIKEAFALGRKVVVFHDYNEGGGISPFTHRPASGQKVTSYVEGKTVENDLGDLYDDFARQNPYIKDLDFGKYPAPIYTLTQAFPEALVYNGNVSNKNRNEAKRLFNDDNSGRDLIIVQSAAGEAGISLHDTTGKQQRVHAQSRHADPADDFDPAGRPHLPRWPVLRRHLPLHEHRHRLGALDVRRQDRRPRRYRRESGAGQSGAHHPAVLHRRFLQRWRLSPGSRRGQGRQGSGPRHHREHQRVREGQDALFRPGEGDRPARSARGHRLLRHPRARRLQDGGVCRSQARRENPRTVGRSRRDRALFPRGLGPHPG
jgi:hypothetical protein